MINSQLDLKTPFIFEVPDVLNSFECQDWIKRIQSVGTEPATINTTRGNLVDSQIRNNRRVIFDDSVWANNLFERIKNQVPSDTHGMKLSAVNERLRCYEYQPGHRFAPHSDGAFVKGENEQSWYTFMIYLNEEFEGGETAFFVEPKVVIKPTTGTALFFQHPIIHEGCEVTSGTKYVVRTDLIYKTD